MSNNIKKKPFFSIITVNLNSGEAILKTLASIKEQENKNFEHIVIDGASIDVSYEILQENLETFDYFCSEKDEGIYDAINKGISKAKGEYLILLHSGDYFDGKATLNDISEYILKNPSYDVYLSDVLICSEGSFFNSCRYYPCDVFTASRMRFGIMPPHPAMFFKRELHERIGLYSTKYDIAGDFDLIVRMFLVEGLTYTSCNRVFIKMESGGLSDKIASKIKLQKELLEVCRNWNITTNHFLLLIRYLIKLPGLIPWLASFVKYFKKPKEQHHNNFPKKILIVSECFYPEEFKINEVAISWKEKGYDVDVLTLNPTYPLGEVFSGYKNWFFKKDEYNGVNVYRLRAVTGYKNSLFKKILKYINFMVFGGIAAVFIGKKYDYVFGFNLSSLTDMFPAIIISKLYKKPTMFWVQDIWPDSVYAYGFKKTRVLSALLDSFVRFMHHNINAIAISSKGFESKIKPYTKKGIKFIYAPNWADNLDMDVEPVNLSASQKIHFTFAGNIGKMQNLENIINAFLLLPDEYLKKSQLNIIGNGSNLDNLKLLADNNKNVVFIEMQPRNQIAKFYKASDYLIISLIDEPVFSVTVPAKTQTCIAAKKPILAIINGDVADIVENNNLGVSVSPSNIEMITDALIKCIDMPNTTKEKFINNSDKLLSSVFNKETIIKTLTSTLVE